jgi:hypothetical protein
LTSAFCAKPTIFHGGVTFWTLRARELAAVARDPDRAEFAPMERSDAELVVSPKKQAISIRLE